MTTETSGDSPIIRPMQVLLRRANRVRQRARQRLNVIDLRALLRGGACEIRVDLLRKATANQRRTRSA